MNYINLTDHEIHELDSGLRLAPATTAIRAQCRTTRTVRDGITYHSSDVVRLSSPLPDPQPDTIYVISALALNGVPADRKDIVAPKQVVRSSEGKIIGCRGFRTK
jgi:hypothetical protein